MIFQGFKCGTFIYKVIFMHFLHTEKATGNILSNFNHNSYF